MSIRKISNSGFDSISPVSIDADLISDHKHSIVVTEKGSLKKVAGFVFLTKNLFWVLGTGKLISEEFYYFTDLFNEYSGMFDFVMKED